MHLLTVKVNYLDVFFLHIRYKALKILPLKLISYLLLKLKTLSKMARRKLWRTLLGSTKMIVQNVSGSLKWRRFSFILRFKLLE